jgi:hypothetical protein
MIGRVDLRHGNNSVAGSASRFGRRVFVAAITAIFLIGLAAGAVSASVTTVTWHRLNPGNPPEHERFACLAGATTWKCRYDKLPEPTLGFGWDSTRGTFSGSDTTGDWACPDWFTSDPCDAADTVISGVGTFYFPRASGSFSVDQQLLVSDDGTLWLYWVDQFVCPWYPTFDEALDSDPSCVFAP